MPIANCRISVGSLWNVLHASQAAWADWCQKKSRAWRCRMFHEFFIGLTVGSWGFLKGFVMCLWRVPMDVVFKDVPRFFDGLRMGHPVEWWFFTTVSNGRGSFGRFAILALHREQKNQRNRSFFCSYGMMKCWSTFPSPSYSFYFKSLWPYGSKCRGRRTWIHRVLCRNIVILE